MNKTQDSMLYYLLETHIKCKDTFTFKDRLK